MTGAQAIYQSHSVVTAGPARWVGMLYEKAIELCDTAAEDLRAGVFDPSAIHEMLTRTQRIVLELELALDHDRGGDISVSLASLYEFCRARLVEANVAKDFRPLADVGQVLRDLREAWDVVECEVEGAA
ncbi:MAG: flagellar export chaperone FliS [Acidimicrobiia bacterium]